MRHIPWNASVRPHQVACFVTRHLTPCLKTTFCLWSRIRVFFNFTSIVWCFKQIFIFLLNCLTLLYDDSRMENILLALRFCVCLLQHWLRLPPTLWFGVPRISVPLCCFVCPCYKDNVNCYKDNVFESKT